MKDRFVILPRDDSAPSAIVTKFVKFVAKQKKRPKPLYLIGNPYQKPAGAGFLRNLICILCLFRP